MKLARRSYRHAEVSTDRSLFEYSSISCAEEVDLGESCGGEDRGVCSKSGVTPNYDLAVRRVAEHFRAKVLKHLSEVRKKSWTLGRNVSNDFIQNVVRADRLDYA